MPPPAQIPIVVTPAALTRANAFVAAAKAATSASVEGLGFVMPPSEVMPALTTFQHGGNDYLSGDVTVSRLCVRGQQLITGWRSIWDRLPFHVLPQEDPPVIPEMDFFANRHLVLRHPGSYNDLVTLRFRLSREPLAEDTQENTLALDIDCLALLRNSQPFRRAGQVYWGRDGEIVCGRNEFLGCGFSREFGETAVTLGLALLFDYQIVVETPAGT